MYKISLDNKVKYQEHLHLVSRNHGSPAKRHELVDVRPFMVCGRSFRQKHMYGTSQKSKNGPF